MKLGVTIAFAVLSLISFLGSVMFKIMHWPGGRHLRIASFICLAIAGIFLFLYQRSSKIPSAPDTNNPDPTPSPEKPENEEEILEDFWEFEDEE